ncbi:MAG: OsmC family protein [Bacteroidota bacterium]
MNTAELVYQGELRTLATHVYSGTTLFTDAPLDNQGKAQSFSPTDMVAVALASCIMTTIGILMKDEGIPFEGTRLKARKIMASNPRRIAAIEIDIEVSEGKLTTAQKERMIQIGHSCPVALSLHPDLEQRVEFSFK